MIAVITGATSGIGQEMAKILANRGWGLVLTGRNEEMLRQMQKTLPTRTRIIPLDLAEPDAPMRLIRFCEGLHIDLLVNNAGFGTFGRFSETSLDTELSLLAVNVRAVHILTKHFLQQFRAQGSGRILNVASVAGFFTGPLLSSYYASKNYVLRLSTAIAEELRREKSPVRICVLCPGPVDTRFNERAGVSFPTKGITARQAALAGLEGVMHGRVIVVPGLMMQVGAALGKCLPETMQARVMYLMQKRKGR